jgi:hypothetical protein
MVQDFERQQAARSRAADPAEALVGEDASSPPGGHTSAFDEPAGPSADVTRNATPPNHP